MGTEVELRLLGPLTDDAVTTACEALRARLRQGGVSRVLCHLDGVPSDLTAVDVLARLRLLARRAGVPLVLQGHDPGLPALLELVGLSELLTSPSPSTSPGPDTGTSGQQGRSMRTVAGQWTRPSPRGGVR